MTELSDYLRHCPIARTVRGILAQSPLPVSGLAWILRGRATARQVGRAVLELRRLGAVEFAYRGFIRRGTRKVKYWRAR